MGWPVRMGVRDRMGAPGGLEEGELHKALFFLGQGLAATRPHGCDAPLASPRVLGSVGAVIWYRCSVQLRKWEGGKDRGRGRKRKSLIHSIL